ncbi:MAG: putative metallopeptidase [Candidatus ainarchaeum sp.]|nr:putative metallopeptidase [Candidatus ainarchaeum sp.]
MDVGKAEDIQLRIDGILSVLGNEFDHVINARIISMRSKNSKARAYARIWSLPKIWRVALEINPFYVIEVLSENFDNLSEDKKIKVLIHELLHIPKGFSGGLVPHNSRGIKINSKTVDKVYEIYKNRIK